LDELIEKHQDDWHTILSEYQRLRKPDGDAIADLAIQNFTEMRDKTADAKFLLQKKIEAVLHEKYPNEWIPAYSLVTFSPQVRYSEALARGRRQEAIMQEFMDMPDIAEKWNDAELHQSIIQKIASYN
jgi:kynurenine 3-monooxygenase